MTRTKSSRALLSVVLAVLMVAAFMPALTYSSFAATAKKATKVTKTTHNGTRVYGKVGKKYVLKYKLSPSKLTSAAKKVVWKSSDSSVVKVYSTNTNRAAVKVKGVGTAKVTVYTKANPSAKETWTFKTKAAEQKVAATGVTVKANNTSADLQVGTVLSATVAPANATGVTYQWYADGTAIEGATSSQFTVTSDQIGKKISVKAKANTGDEVTSAETAAVAGATLNGIAGITGHAQVGEKLTVVAAKGAGFTNLEDVATIQWYRVTKDVNDNEVETAISGATSASYTATAADQGAQLRVKVTPKAGVKALQTKAANWNTTAKAYVATTGTVQKAAVQVTGIEVQVNGKAVSGDVKAGTTLTAVVTPAAASSDVDYQWYQNGYKIAGATSATYTPSESGSYTVKATVKSTSTAYKAGSVDTTKSPVTVKASKTFSGVTVKNVTATNAGRTTTQAGDKLSVSVSGVKADTYDVALAKVGTDDYGQTKYDTEGNGTKVSDSAYTVEIPSGAKAGYKYVVKLTGKTGTTSADYGYTSDALTVVSSTAATVTGFSTTYNTGAIKSVTLNNTVNKTINKDYTVQWYKVTKDATDLISSSAISGATGNTYELTTTDAADTTAKYVAKVTTSDGAVAYVSGNKIGEYETISVKVHF